MTWESRALGRQRVEYDSTNAANLLRVQLEIDGAKVTPTSATVTVYAPGNTTALVAAAAMTLSGSILSYAVDTTTETSYPIGQGYRAEVSILYSAKTYKRVVVFDVVRFIVKPTVTVDQLIGLDDQVRGMKHDSAESLAPLIVACQDVIQADLETRVVRSKRLQQSMILDYSKVDTAFRFLVLHQLFINKRDFEVADRYEKKYENLLAAALSSQPLDKDQSGEEEPEIEPIEEVRFVR